MFYKCNKSIDINMLCVFAKLAFYDFYLNKLKPQLS